MVNQHRCRNAYILATRDASGNPARMVIFPDEGQSIVLGDFGDDLIVPEHPPLVQYLDEIQATAIWREIARFVALCESLRGQADDGEDEAAFRRLATLVLAPEAAGYGADTLAA